VGVIRLKGEQDARISSGLIFPTVAIEVTSTIGETLHPGEV
jgi:hypothetical protein